MKYLSVCSGIEAATVAWHPLGWQAVGYSEIEKFPSQVLAHHYPNVPNFGDMTKFKEWNLESNVDVFVGGTPCQSFSVAGLRKGLDDPRGNLMLTYLAIADKYRPRWLVWENVPGVLSSNGGKDFGTFLGGLGELGYGFAYRVLDAQYFGVAQRRRRVFVVGYLGDWRRAAAVLFERHSLSGDSAPLRKKREGITSSSGTSIESSLNCGVELTGPLSARDYKDAGTDGMNKNSAKMIPVIKQWPAEISSTLDTTFGTKQGLEDQHVNAGCPMFVPTKKIVLFVYENHPADSRVQEMGEVCSTVTSRWETGGGNIPFTTAYSIREDAQANTFSATELEVATALKALQPSVQSHHAQTFITQSMGTDLYNGAITGEVAATMTKSMSGTGTGPTAMQPIGFEANMSLQQPSTKNIFQTLTRRTHASVNIDMAVRRLLPRECERLQGFPDDYTDIKPNGKQTSDGPRYKALGNSMAVPVMAWIGKRIQEVENL
jgi:DNA (cytosine-5)-methyltransferase 1